MAAFPAPALSAPSSEVVVTVSAIDSTMMLVGVQCSQLWSPAIKGFDRFRAGTWCLLIEHPSGRKLIYDLGCRKDWENLSPALGLKRWVDAGVLKELTVQKNVSEVLTGRGIDLNDIEAVVWSHYHFDHTGDMSTFPPSTKLIVGPGTKESFMPGYPADPDAHTLESDFAGREVVEIDFSRTNLTIGRFKAFDYFGDGSFYILDSPGHAIGHLNAFARTHATPCPSFIHMCGDAVHHGAEIRPSIYLPLPQSISPSPVPHLHPVSCPGETFAQVLRDGSETEHILEWRDYTKGMSFERKYAGTYDEPALRESVRKIEECDGHDNVFTIMAHDFSLKGVIDEWPSNLNDWMEKGWRETTRWKFLADFAEVCT